MWRDQDQEVEAVAVALSTPMQSKTNECQRLTPTQRAIAVLLAAGLSGSKACQKVKVDPTTLVRWKKQPAFRKRLEELLAQSESDALQTLHALRCKAAEKLGDLMGSDNPAIALRAAEAVLDRTANPYVAAKLNLNPIPKEWEEVLESFERAA